MRGARQIADYLDLLRADLATVERLARELGAHSGPDWRRPSPLDGRLAERIE